jgi:hypothetical protein
MRLKIGFFLYQVSPFKKFIWLKLPIGLSSEAIDPISGCQIDFVHYDAVFRAGLIET